MEIATKIAPIGLAMIMLTLGFGLTIKDFLRVFKIPKDSDLFWSPQYNVPIFPIKAKKRVVTIHDVYQMAHFHELTLIKKIYVKVIGKIKMEVGLTNISKKSIIVENKNFFLRRNLK